jgi:cytochrome c oxidase cbb3-type subunit 1
MNGEEWVYSIIHMRPYWFVRTLSGVSMDVGMGLLVVNLMMTALTSPREASQPIPRGPSGRLSPIPAGGPAE